MTLTRRQHSPLDLLLDAGANLNIEHARAQMTPLSMALVSWKENCLHFIERGGRFLQVSRPYADASPWALALVRTHNLAPF